MHDGILEFASDRELATAFWLCVVVVGVVAWDSTRKAASEFLRVLATWKIWLPLATYVGLLLAVVLAAARVSLWDMSLLGATVLWLVLTGFGLLMNAVTDGAKEEGYFRRQVLRTIQIAAIVEFYVNISSFPLAVEIVLQPTLVLLFLVREVSAHSPEHAPARNLLDAILGVVGVVVVVITTSDLVRAAGATDWTEIGRGFLMPLWLTVAATGLSYVFAVVAGYEILVMRLNWNAGRLPLRSALGFACSLRGNVRDINSFPPYLGREAIDVGTFVAARDAVMKFRAERKAGENRRAANRALLATHVGATGVDSEGRRLDRREFQATKEALNWLWTCHAGHFRNLGRYRRDLLTVLGDFDRQGLANPHGVEMHVNKKGSRWYAFRRTVTGWHFGIGASADPNDQWFFDGPQPPVGYPSSEGGWTHFMSDLRTEWYPEPEV